MEIAIVNVNAVSASLECGRQIPRGLVGGKVTIHYQDPVWDALIKTAVFRGAVTKDVMNVSDTAEIPWETVETAGKKLYFGLYGTNADGSLVVPTVWTELGVIEGAADPSGDQSTEPSPDVWEQMRAMIGNLSDLDTQNKDTVVAAVNESLARGGTDEAEVRAVVMDCLETVGTGADVYILAEGETLADAAGKADVVLAPDESGGIWADWNAAEGEVGYIQNRPFGDETVCVLPETELEFSYEESLYGAFTEPQQLPVAGSIYNIRFGDGEYSCMCETLDDGLTMGNLGVMGGPDTGEPFMIAIYDNVMMIVTTEEVSRVVVAVSGVQPVPIKPAYAPESVVLDLVSLGLPTVKENAVVSIPFTDTQTLALAYKNGGLRLILDAEYSYTNVFAYGNVQQTIQTSVCVTAQIRRDSFRNFSIRALLEDSIIFIAVNAGTLSAVIRRIALA